MLPINYQTEQGGFNMCLGPLTTIVQKIKHFYCTNKEIPLKRCPEHIYISPCLELLRKY